MNALQPAPDIASVPTAQALLQRLEWTVLKRLDGALQGDYRTLLRGHGIDLADLREYQYHDDVRHIDWNVTARLQVPHVRQFTEDRELCVWFLLDLSPSVDFGSRQRKRSVSEAFVAVMARWYCATATAPAPCCMATRSIACCRPRAAGAMCCT